MKVLHTNFLRGWGGQSNRILTECIGLCQLGYDVTVSAPPGSELVQRAKQAGVRTVETIYYRGLRGGFVKDVREMKRLLAEFAPEIIHLHGGRDSWVAAAALAGTNRKAKPIIIRTKHNIFPISDHFLNRWQYGRFFDSIVAISNAIVAMCCEKPYIGNTKVCRIPSAVDCRRFERAAESRAGTRAEFGIADENIVVAMTGRLRPEKGHDVLLRAVPAIVAAHQNVKFLLIGAGSEQQKLREAIEGAGLESHCILTGFRNDVPALLAAADVYVQPSLSEGLGTSVLEAAAACLPIAASAVGGIPDIIAHEQTGLLVVPGAADDLSAAVKRLISDQALREELRRNARKKVEREYSVERLTNATDELYGRLATAV